MHLSSILPLLLSSVLLLQSPPVVGQDAVRIGATMSLTGSYSTQGIPARNGYELCAKHVNAEDGLLGRSVQFEIHDDESNTEIAAAHYERLIVEEGVDAVMGPYGSTLTEAVAPVTERHRMVHISPLAAATSIWEQGHEYLFMVLPPAELFLAGLIEMAHERGLQRVAVLQEDALFPRTAGQGAADLSRERGMEVVLHATYPSGTTDFSDLLQELDSGGAQVVAMAASTLSDFAAVIEQMRAARIDVDMFGTSGAVTEFQEALGADAEYVYGLSAWEPSVPNPGAAAFTADYERLYGHSPSFHAAGAYGACMLLVEAARGAGSLETDALREQLLDLQTTTIFGDFAVDERGYQTAHRGLFIQWQDGEKVVVWPDDLAVEEARYPTPSWSER